jgi:hypothetical protein
MSLHLKIGQRLGPSEGSTDLRVIPGEQADTSARERDLAVAPPGQGELIEKARERLTTLAP